MLTLQKRIDGFLHLRDYLMELSNPSKSHRDFDEVVQKTSSHNPWFTPKVIHESIEGLVQLLDPFQIQDVVNKYYLGEPTEVRKVAVIMAGNIPMVNFHDYLCILLSGHRFLGKLSSQDKYLLPFFSNKLITFDEGWREYIQFTEEKLTEFDAVIATGSNNSSRYFEYYFGKYPHIIRKNRNSVAILSGNESEDDFKNLFSDVFQYYGLGCRNISQIIVPENYSFIPLFDAWQELGNELLEHNKYKNNYDYYRAMYLVNKNEFFDTGFASVFPSEEISSPVSVIHYWRYHSSNQVKEFLELNKEKIQCVISNVKEFDSNVTYTIGKSQVPSIFDYPDQVDIFQFLLGL